MPYSSFNLQNNKCIREGQPYLVWSPLRTQNVGQKHSSTNLKIIVFPTIIMLNISRTAHIFEVLFLGIPAWYYLYKVRVKILVCVSDGPFCNSGCKSDIYINQPRPYSYHHTTNIHITSYLTIQHDYMKEQSLVFLACHRDDMNLICKLHWICYNFLFC